MTSLDNASRARARGTVAYDPLDAIEHLKARGLSDADITAKLLGPNRARQLERMELQNRDAADLIADQIPTAQAVRVLRRLHGISRRKAYYLLKQARCKSPPIVVAP